MDRTNPFQEISDRLDAIELLLVELKSSSAKSNPDQPKYLNAHEAAKYIRLSVAALYKLTSTKSIPFTKKHKALLFKSEDLDLWISSGQTSNPKLR